MEYEIGLGVPAGQQERVAEIIYEGFHDKFRKIFGSKERSITLIAKYLRDDRIVVAIHEGLVVGVGGLKFGDSEFLDVSFKQLLKELKFGIFRVLFFGWVFYNRVKEKEVILETLAVTRSMRELGIGSSLLRYIINFARSRGFEKIRLSVIDVNIRAQKLYKRIGFKEVSAMRIIFPWNTLLGINATTEMMYSLKE